MSDTENLNEAADSGLPSHALLGFCRDCKHWQLTKRTVECLKEYPRDKPESDWWLSSVCRRLQYGVEITARGGWEGAWVNQVETDANFGCRFFEPNADVDTRRADARIKEGG